MTVIDALDDELLAVRRHLADLIRSRAERGLTDDEQWQYHLLGTREAELLALRRRSP